MRLKDLFTFKLFSRGAEKVVNKSAEIVAKSPEAASLTETVIKRITNYAHVGERIIHFHLVVFGIMMGFTLMTSIIALGKLAMAMELHFLVQNSDLIFKFGYASFFAGISYGFFRHYTSKHHERHIRKEQQQLTQDHEQKKLNLKIEYDELKSKLEQQISEKKEVLRAIENEIAKRQDATSVWDTISSYNPVGTRSKTEAQNSSETKVPKAQEGGSLTEETSSVWQKISSYNPMTTRSKDDRKNK